MNQIKDYEGIVGKNYITQLKHLAQFSKDKKIIMVNSTKTGGGVAEILHRLIPLIQDLGVDCTWKTIKGDEDFFNTTKGFHNALQGKQVKFTNEELNYYLQINENNAKNIDLDADIVVIHDPQPLPIINYYKRGNAKWVWRCHIDTSKPDLSLWRFLRKYLLMYDASIYSIPKFSRKLPHPQFIIPPSIDPLADKNRELSEKEIVGFLEDHHIIKDKPIILQVSRFDIFKDPIGVIQAYRLVKKELDCQLVLAGGAADDDPEGQIVLDAVKKEAGANL
jgi:trehalose synthase